jgi:hypothetical protein
MMSKFCSAIAILFSLGALLTGGCDKTTSSPGTQVRATLAAIQPPASPPLAATFAAPGNRWNDDQSIPWPVARTFAEVCNLSYATEAEVNAAFARWGIGKVSHFPSGSLYACVASDDRTVLIAFRGTDDAKDWLVNTDAILQTVPHGIVHRGFYQGMKTLYDNLVSAATAQGAEKKNIWITGHSLGGALAVAFAYECLTQGKLRPAGLVTFGQPLLADSALAAYVSGELGGNYVRFVNERDVVTRVPPGYVHFGKLIWFHDGKLVVEKTAATSHPELSPLSMTEFESLQRGLRDLRQLSNGLDPARLRSYGEQVAAITDHFMSGYLQGIDKFAR